MQSIRNSTPEHRHNPSITLCNLFEFLLIHGDGLLAQSNETEDVTGLSTVIIIQVIDNRRV